MSASGLVRGGLVFVSLGVRRKNIHILNSYVFWITALNYLLGFIEVKKKNTKNKNTLFRDAVL